MPRFAIVAALIAALFAAPVLAQEEITAPPEAMLTDPAAADAGFAVFKGSDCAGCHGWSLNGERIGENPKGPSLRQSTLDPLTMKQIILCGIPGSQMPAHDVSAYSDGRCFGLTEADIQGQRLNVGKDMSQPDADTLVAYIQQRIMGQPDQPSQEDCKAYYGGKPFCNTYPLAADR